jgi:hypothetical protein
LVKIGDYVKFKTSGFHGRHLGKVKDVKESIKNTNVFEDLVPARNSYKVIDILKEKALIVQTDEHGDIDDKHSYIVSMSKLEDNVEVFPSPQGQKPSNQFAKWFNEKKRGSRRNEQREK